MTETYSQLKQAIRAALPDLIRAAESDLSLPETGEFHPLQVTVRNPEPTLYAGNIHMLIRGGKEAGDKIRFLDVRVETPSGKSIASTGYPFMGLKGELMQELQMQRKNPERLVQSVYDAVRFLRETEKA